MGRKQDGRSRSLIQFAALDAHEPIFEHVCSPHTVATADFVQCADESRTGHALSIQCHREALIKRNPDISRFIGRLQGADRPLPGIFRRFH